ncbi:MAG: OmpA family protein [Bdellovibrionales bacterium]|nr:OmpA family protein [Bdellovibrionales bacterium]
MKRALFISVFLTTLMLMAIGCSSKKSGLNGSDIDGMSESDLNYQREARYGDGSVPTAEGEGMFRDVRFNYDSAQISGEGLQNIEYNAQLLQDNPNIRIQLEGHCDERGTAEYNMALGQERAKSVQDVLLSYGVASNRIQTISYGEEVPLDPALNEQAFAKNRRVHFSAFQ